MVDPGVLREFRLFSDLNDDELAKLAAIAKIEHRDKGLKIIREGGAARHLFLLRKGKVDIVVPGPSGAEIQIDEIGPGELFGWVSMTGPYTLTASMVAVEDAEYVALNANNLRHLLDSDKAIGYSVMRAVASTVARRLHGMQEHYAALKLNS